MVIVFFSLEEILTFLAYNVPFKSLVQERVCSSRILIVQQMIPWMVKSMVLYWLWSWEVGVSRGQTGSGNPPVA